MKINSDNYVVLSTQEIKKLSIKRKKLLKLWIDIVKEKQNVYFEDSKTLLN